MTAMDKRQFAPPIESDWERVVNMANTCETFKINSSTTARLINHGFNSITLLSMAVDFEERGVTGDRLKQCLSVLNDKRSHPLEPSYSLQRLINTRRKHWYIMKKYQFLDLANVDLKKPPPPSRDCKVMGFYKLFSLYRIETFVIIRPVGRDISKRFFFSHHYGTRCNI